MNSISTCIWFDDQAGEAADFYSKIFPTFKMGTSAKYTEASAKVSQKPVGSVLTVDFEIDGRKILALNGGPMFKPSPALSYFIWRHSRQEVTDLWNQLKQGGEIRMDLAEYPWSPLYGWVQDKFGVDWQIMLSKSYLGLAPCLLFVEKLYGKGSEAVQFYTSIFPNSQIKEMNKDPKAGTVMHSVLNLDGHDFVFMEGAGKHAFSFSEGHSIIVSCKNQLEIDQRWDALIADGGRPSQCGWLVDKYGVSWQVVYDKIGQMMSDPKRAQKVMAEIMKMKKLDVQILEKAYQS